MTAKQETKTPEMPIIIEVEEMPKPHRGRHGSTMDLSAFIELLKDSKNHAIDQVEDKSHKDKWLRHLRLAATQADLEVETTYSRPENRLYFRGWKKGEAPARGRRKLDSRNQNQTV